MPQQSKKLLLLYHTVSIFSVNEAQTWMWGSQDKPAIFPKTKDCGIIMLSDFIKEHNGYLCLSQQELSVARGTNPDFPE